MGRHTATRNPTHRIANVLALVAACGLWAGTMAVTAPQPEPTSQVSVWPKGGVDVGQPEEDQAGWNCTTMGNRVCGLLPLGTELQWHGVTWVVTVSGLEPVGTN